MNARGWSCYTTKGQTGADELASSLYQAATIHLPGHKIRMDYTDGDPDIEENFYILRHTSCPAVLTENFFMDNREDVAFLESEEGAAAIVRGERIMKPETLATAIRIGNPASWKQAEAARDESGGKIGCVTDEKIVEAYKMLAASEGILCEPASAASVAGLIQSHSLGLVKEGSDIVCILTGNGLKDPDNAIKYSNADVKKTSAELSDVLKAMGI